MKFVNAALLGVLLLCCLVIGNVKASCSLNAEHPRPLEVLRFGSKLIHSDRRKTTSYFAETDQTINLFCSQGFFFNRMKYNIHDLHIELTCSNNEFNNHYLRNLGLYSLNSIKCKGVSANQIYESKNSLSDCNDHMTLVVGHDLGEFGQIKTVAFCYNIDKAELKYASYVAYPIRNRVLENNSYGDMEYVGLNEVVAYRKDLFKPANNDEASQEWSRSHEFKQLFTDSTFEYLSIIQDEDFTSELENYSEMHSIAWLHALRVGNWRHFLNAMKAATTSHQGNMFQVHVGVSGVIKVPMIRECNSTHILTIEIPNDGWATVPAHVWAHVRPLLNKKVRQPQSTIEANEFVLIGHNSPFYLNDSSSKLCSSMCNEIPWLRQSLFGQLQNYFLYGSVECCRVADVAHKLDNFPKSRDTAADALNNDEEMNEAVAKVAQPETAAQENATLAV